jgi:hypothetical protein
VNAALTANGPLIITREWPWGLAFVRDSGWSDHPESIDGRSVVAMRGELVTKILHLVDGAATLELTLASPDGLMLVHEGDLEIPSGVLEITDAAEQRVDTVDVPSGTWRAAVWVNDTDSPTRVVIHLHRLTLVQ